MKRSLLSLVLLFSCCISFGQWTNHSFQFDGQTRNYRTYLPASYNPAQPASLIVVLHGLGGTMYDAMGVGITPIADTANIILVSPQALDFASPIGTVPAAWNSGIVLNLPLPYGDVAVNGNVKDVAFINAIVDSTQDQYSIKEGRVYVCGISMGGFMTQRLACESGSTFNAAASLEGTYSKALPPCQPGITVPIAHFHGTNDEVVSYEGNLLFGSASFPVGLSVDTLISKWVSLNGCSTTPEHTAWNDTNNDGIFIDHYIYADAALKSRVELFKINGGIHTWYDYTNTGGEFDFSTEIWKFFNKQYSYGPVTGIEKTASEKITAVIYPNPAQDIIKIQSKEQFQKAVVTDICGKVQLETSNVAAGIDVHALPSGVYFVKLYNHKGMTATAKISKL
jgi:polyhydroxybutyrate depolymerase